VLKKRYSVVMNRQIMGTFAAAALLATSARAVPPCSNPATCVVTDRVALAAITEDAVVPCDFRLGEYCTGGDGATGIAPDPIGACGLNYGNTLESPADAINSLDHHWLQSTTTPIVVDFGSPVTAALVFGAIDHGPLPEEGIEFTVWGSDSCDIDSFPTGWTKGTLARIWKRGWEDPIACQGQDNADDYVSQYSFASPGVRYVAVHANNSITIFDDPTHATWQSQDDSDPNTRGWQSADDEIDAVGTPNCDAGRVVAVAFPEPIAIANGQVCFNALGSFAELGIADAGWDTDGDGVVDVTGPRVCVPCDVVESGRLTLFVTDRCGCVGTDTAAFCCLAESVTEPVIDADGIDTPGHGGAAAVDTPCGATLSDFPAAVQDAGLDWFDNDHDGQWTFGPDGDDLHSEDTTTCPTANRNGVHDLGQDCKIIDLDASLFSGQQVDCDLEVNVPFTPPHIFSGGCPSSLNNIRWYDANGDGGWDSGEDIILDANGNGTFDCSPSTRRLNTTQKGSLLVFSKIEIKWDADGNLTQDTFLDWSNDADEGSVDVQAYFINGDRPLEEIQLDDGTITQEEEPGWNPMNCRFEMTKNEPHFWSAAHGSRHCPAAFTTLDEVGPGRPDPEVPGGRVLRGFAVMWAVKFNPEGGYYEEIRWNHLKGDALLINYAEGSAWEYNAWAAAAHCGEPGGGLVDCFVTNPTGTVCAGRVIPGRLGLDGLQYDITHDRMLLDFYASGSAAFSSRRTDGTTDVNVTLDTDLTLHPMDIDLRQDGVGPILTKAEFEVFNENEVKLSGLRRCICCWDQTMMGTYAMRVGIPNYFLRSRLGTDKGMARIDGVRSVQEECDYCEVCGIEPRIRDLGIPGVAGIFDFDRCELNMTRDTALLGVSAKLLSFEGRDAGPSVAGGDPPPDLKVERAGMNLVGVGEQLGEVLINGDDGKESDAGANDVPLFFQLRGSVIYHDVTDSGDPEQDEAQGP